MTSRKKSVKTAVSFGWLFSALVLSACGGGGGAGTKADTSSPGSSPSGSAGVAAPSPAESTSVSQQPSEAGWTECAFEGGTCTVPGTRMVRYGVNNIYVYKTVTGSIACNNDAWGDPFFGTAKSCDYDGNTAAPPDPATVPGPVPVAAPTLVPAAWSVVASEYQSFSVSGTKTLRDGLNNSWVTKTVTGSGVCSNDFFGMDPVYGAQKQCEIDGSSDQSGLPAPAPAPAPAPEAIPVAVPTPAPIPSAVAPSPTLGNPLDSARIMISGHSLTDNPLADYMALIAQSKGTPMWWNEQIVFGSQLRLRSRGENVSDTSFSGYSTGKNRNGGGMNIASELANPQTLGGERYDTLLLSERYDLANMLMSEDTVRYARHFHERLIAGNARANSYLYHPWLEVNKDAPGDWINYERAAAPAWQCVAERVNVSLVNSNRSDRMAYLPAGLALTDLVEQATRGSVAGISGGSVRQTMDQFFGDDVHLTARGTYYVALVSYASIYRRSPVGAWAPDELTAQQARSLQEVAWQSVSKHYNNASAPSMGQCQAMMQASYCQAFANFRGGAGMRDSCVGRFTQQSQDNPFYFNAASDASYWFAAPR